MLFKIPFSPYIIEAQDYIQINLHGITKLLGVFKTASQRSSFLKHLTIDVNRIFNGTSSIEKNCIITESILQVDNEESCL